MEVTVIVSIAVGGLVGLVLMIGIIVCVVRYVRRRKMDDSKVDDNKAGEAIGNEYSTVPGGLPPPGFITSSGGVSVINTRAAESDPAGDTITSNGQGSAELNAPTQDNSPTVVPIQLNGNRPGQTVLNQEPSVTTQQSTVTPPDDKLDFTTASAPEPRTVLNSISGQTVAGPIVPQQASLLYPQLPAPAPIVPVPNPMMPMIPNPVPNPMMQFAPNSTTNPMMPFMPNVAPNPMMPLSPNSMFQMANQGFMPAPTSNNVLLNNPAVAMGSQATGVVPYGGTIPGAQSAASAAPAPIQPRPVSGPQGTHVDNDGFTVVRARLSIS